MGPCSPLYLLALAHAVEILNPPRIMLHLPFSGHLNQTVMSTSHNSPAKSFSSLSVHSQSSLLLQVATS